MLEVPSKAVRKLMFYNSKADLVTFFACVNLTLVDSAVISRKKISNVVYYVSPFSQQKQTTG